MYQVRSYNEEYHPDLFKGGGVLGFAIRTLNFLRWRLEVFVQYLTLRYLLRAQNFSLKERERVLKTFRLDVIKEKVEYAERSPLHMNSLPAVPSLDKEQKSAAPSPSVDDAPGRPIEFLIAEYGRSRRRKKRGYVARDLFTEPGSEEDQGRDGDY